MGGHAEALLERSSPSGRLLGLDADPAAIEIAARRLARFGERVVLVHSNFAHLGRVAQAHGFVGCAGIVFDLGISSPQIAPGSDSGLSFLGDAPLDMRLDPSQGVTAADIVNSWSERDLADAIYRLGDESASRRIARAIVKGRPLRTSGQLAQVIEQAIGRHGKLHPATRTFLALRRLVNKDEETLASALPQAIALLAPGGRLAVISFHSGEDRIVKRFLVQESKDCICPPKMPCVCGHKATIRLLHRHVIVPSNDEQRANPRSRSARLRIAEKLPSG
jgi:16S rRNA (cytosine1402-N4)-methyltransferase